MREEYSVKRSKHCKVVFFVVVMQEASNALGKLQAVTLCRPIRSIGRNGVIVLLKAFGFLPVTTALKRRDRSKQCHCSQFVFCCFTCNMFLYEKHMLKLHLSCSVL